MNQGTGGAASCPRLQLEPADAILVGRDVTEEHLDGDFPPQLKSLARFTSPITPAPIGDSIS